MNPDLKMRHKSLVSIKVAIKCTDKTDFITHPDKLHWLPAQAPGPAPTQTPCRALTPPSPSRLPVRASGRSRRWRGSPLILWAWGACSFYPAWPSIGAATAAGRRRGAEPWTLGRQPGWPEPRRGRNCRTTWWWRARLSLWSTGKCAKCAGKSLHFRSGSPWINKKFGVFCVKAQSLLGVKTEWMSCMVRF